MNDTDALELDLFHRFLSLFYRKHQKLLFLLLSQKYFQPLQEVLQKDITVIVDKLLYAELLQNKACYFIFS